MLELPASPSSSFYPLPSIAHRPTGDAPELLLKTKFQAAIHGTSHVTRVRHLLSGSALASQLRQD